MILQVRDQYHLDLAYNIQKKNGFRLLLNGIEIN